MIWTAALFAVGYQLVRMVPIIMLYAANPDMPLMMVAAWSNVGVVVLLLALLQARGVVWDVMDPGDINTAAVLAVIGAVIAAYVFTMVLTGLLVHVTGPDGYYVSQDFIDLVDSAPTSELIFSIVLIGPIAEEVIYRGLAMGVLLARGWRPVTVIALTTLVFTLQHFQYGWIGLANVFVFGAAFGVLRVATGGLAAPIAAHMLTNALQTLFVSVPTPGS